MTLWLTRIDINPRSRHSRDDLRNTTGLHRRVMSLFAEVDAPNPRAELGVLHRLDDGPATPRLLVQSHQRPNLDQLPDGYADCATIDLAPLLDRLRPGTVVRYRVVANATKRVAAGERAGKRIALGDNDTRDWWTKRTAENLQLIDTPALTAIHLTGTDPRGNRVTLRPWRIDGIGAVTDPGALRKLIETGLGKGRSFGCGLLTVALA